MVGITKIGHRNRDYWISAVAEGGEDYYTKPGEAPGRWLGDLAWQMGLEGEVDRDSYAAILAGENPHTGAVLVKRPDARTFVDAQGKTRRKEPILGYDIRFSAPKSVSLMWAIGTPDVQDRVLRCHHEAVAAAFGYIEDHACFVQRGKGGREIERGSGMAAMDFLHCTSRSGDPAIHSHLVTANMTRAESDGKWLSLANPKRESPLLREAKAAGYTYEAVLRDLMTRELGAEWEQVVNGIGDLRGIDRAVIDQFSQRRQEILAEMAERGTSSARAAEVAAYRTRPAKDYAADRDAQRAGWRARAAEFDLTPATIDALLARWRPREPDALSRQHAEAALGELEAKHSHFDRRDLLCALANQMRDGVDRPQLEAAVEELAAGERLRVVHRGHGLLATTYYTTPRLWELEQKVLAVAREGIGAEAAMVDDGILAGVLDRHRYLSDEQVHMVARLTQGGERIITVAALPGAGKTTALKPAAQAWGQAGIPGLGVAAARSASGQLGDGAEIPATSIADLLIRCESRISRGLEPLPRGTVIVVDEASTASTTQLAALVTLAERCEGKLVLIGDPRQIGAVGPGGLYGTLTNELDTVLLTEIRRQRNPLDREIVELAHEGRGSDALDLLHADERLIVTDVMPEALDALSLDWHRSFLAGEDAVMIARRGADVADLNARARLLLAADGRLGPKSVSVGGELFAAGDRIVTRANNPQVSNRERWEVTGVDPRRRQLRVRRIEGDEREMVLGKSYLDRRTENGGPAVEHAYALTTYATQSKTFESAFAFLDSGISREDFTVAVSRARGEVKVYGVAATELLDADLGPATREVLDELHDLRLGAERVASEFSADEIGERKRIEALAPDELIARREELSKRLDPLPGPDPIGERLSAIENRLARETERLAQLSTEREHALSTSDRDSLALIDTSERMTRDQVARLEGERNSFAAQRDAAPPAPAGPSGRERAEAALIDDRLLQLRRADVAAERMRPSEMVIATLGPRPESAGERALWNEGVDLIYAYRQRHRVHTVEGNPLGRTPRDATRRQDYRDVDLRLREIRDGLQLEPVRTRDRGMSLER